MFAVNDHIVYGNHGVCKVENIGTVALAMADKNKLYYTLRPVYKNEAVVYAPVENPKSVIRPVLTKEDADKLIEEIPSLEKMNALGELKTIAVPPRTIRILVGKK